jgi:hypothetical protein
MPDFIFTYRHPADYPPGGDGAALAAWGTYFERIGSTVSVPGQPVFERTSIGTVGDGTKLCGYSVVTADNFEAAIALAEACPTLGNGGGVEIGLLAELPADHPAALLKDRSVRA